MTTPATRQRGFTLIELSIVLLIIGLLAGGTVLGQTLVHQARVQRAVSEFNAIRTALNAFNAQYDALPGDFAAAGEYWPDGQWSTGWARMNGMANGDGRWGTGEHAFHEGLWAWQQMAKADILPAGYEPLTGTDSDSAFTFLRSGKNMFASRISGGGYLLLGSRDWFAEDGVDGHIGNYIMLGDFASDKSWEKSNMLLSAEDTMYLDAKMDDGIANTGRFIGQGDCLDGDGQYDLQDGEGKCVAMLLLDTNGQTGTITVAMNTPEPIISAPAPVASLPDEDLGALAPAAGPTSQPQASTPIVTAQEKPVHQCNKPKPAPKVSRYCPHHKA